MGLDGRNRSEDKWGRPVDQEGLVIEEEDVTEPTSRGCPEDALYARYVQHEQAKQGGDGRKMTHEEALKHVPRTEALWQLHRPDPVVHKTYETEEKVEATYDRYPAETMGDPLANLRHLVEDLNGAFSNAVSIHSTQTGLSGDDPFDPKTLPVPLAPGTDSRETPIHPLAMSGDRVEDNKALFEALVASALKDNPRASVVGPPLVVGPKGHETTLPRFVPSKAELEQIVGLIKGDFDSLIISCDYFIGENLAKFGHKNMKTLSSGYVDLDQSKEWQEILLGNCESSQDDEELRKSIETGLQVIARGIAEVEYRNVPEAIILKAANETAVLLFNWAKNTLIEKYRHRSNKV